MAGAAGIDIPLELNVITRELQSAQGELAKRLVLPAYSAVVPIRISCSHAGETTALQLEMDATTL